MWAGACLPAAPRHIRLMAEPRWCLGTGVLAESKCVRRFSAHSSGVPNRQDVGETKVPRWGVETPGVERLTRCMDEPGGPRAQ